MVTDLFLSVLYNVAENQICDLLSPSVLSSCRPGRFVTQRAVGDRQGYGSPIVVGLVWAQWAAVCWTVLAATRMFLVGCYWESCGAEASWKRTDAQVFGSLIISCNQYLMFQRKASALPWEAQWLKGCWATSLRCTCSCEWIPLWPKEGQAVGRTLAEMWQTATIQICHGASLKPDQYLKK